MTVHKTSVAIIGAGPAGLLLGRILGMAGIDHIILERRSRDYVEGRIRAGLLEHPTVELLDHLGLGERLHREGQFDDGFELRFANQRMWVPMAELTGGRQTVLYPQQEVVKDLLEARDASGPPVLFEVEDVELHEVDSEFPRVTCRDVDGGPVQIQADFIAGCDGSHGVSRQAIPSTHITVYENEYPFGWLGILADVPPSTRELIYAHHPNGFAMHSRRSPTLSRLYLQVPRDADPDDYPDQQIWDELQTRMATDDEWTLQEGQILQKGVTAMRSLVVEPMQWGRLYLAGDSAHIVPPTAAKGLNLAVSDITILAEGLMSHYKEASDEVLQRYSATALRRVWRAQEFSRSMTALLHHTPNDSFEARLQDARIENLVSSDAALTTHCEQYVGLPFEGDVARFV